MEKGRGPIGVNMKKLWQKEKTKLNEIVEAFEKVPKYNVSTILPYSKLVLINLM